jgi:prepilin signal peptidase PulO-like enzyme (type II secretory pathway)
MISVLQENALLVCAIVFMIGASLGSFVTMASWRIPRGEDIVFKPSYCPSCRNPLKITHLAPIFSWLWQKGRCGHCQAKIGARYPLTELTLALVAVWLVAAYGIGWQSLLLLLLATELMLMIVTDLEQLIIPDSVQIAVFLTGVAYAFATDAPLLPLLGTSLVGLSIGLSLHYFYLKVRKKDALGWGDIKFLAASGVWLPLAGLIPFLFFAGVIGTVFGLLWLKGKTSAAFPFGPALACSLFLNVLAPGLTERFL